MCCFSRKKGLTLIPDRDLSYFSHTGHNGGNILALGKEENEQGDTHLSLPPLIASSNFSDLMSNETSYGKNFMDSSECSFQLSHDKCEEMSGPGRANLIHRRRKGEEETYLSLGVSCLQLSPGQICVKDL